MMKAGQIGCKPRIIQGEAGNQKLVEIDEVKIDKRQPLWDELEDKGIDYKKNMSKAKLEELLD